MARNQRAYSGDYENSYENNQRRDNRTGRDDDRNYIRRSRGSEFPSEYDAANEDYDYDMRYGRSGIERSRNEGGRYDNNYNDTPRRGYGASTSDSEDYDDERADSATYDDDDYDSNYGNSDSYERDSNRDSGARDARDYERNYGSRYGRDFDRENYGRGQGNSRQYETYNDGARRNYLSPGGENYNYDDGRPLRRRSSNNY